MKKCRLLMIILVACIFTACGQTQTNTQIEATESLGEKIPHGLTIGFCSSGYGTFIQVEHITSLFDDEQERKKDLIIPTSIFGIKVKKMAFGAYRGMIDKEIYAPASIEDIADGIVGGYRDSGYDKDRYHIDKNNPYIEIVNGMILSKDHKKLFYVFPLQNTITIPKEVEVISPYSLLDTEYPRKGFVKVEEGNKDFSCISGNLWKTQYNYFFDEEHIEKYRDCDSPLGERSEFRDFH